MVDNKGIIGKAIVYFILIIGAVCAVYPLIWMIAGSFKYEAEILSYPISIIPVEATMDNFKYVLSKMNFFTFLKNSLFISIVKTGIILYTSALVGYVFDKIEFKGRSVIFMFILATMMIPWPVTIIPTYLQMAAFKWTGSYISLIVPFLFSSFGIFMMRQSVSAIPMDLVNSARIDGASEVLIFHKIIIPLLGSAFAALGIFNFVWTWDDFMWPYLMINSLDKYTVPIGLSLFNGQYAIQIGYALASASIAIVPVLVVYIIFQKQFIEGIALTGIK